MPKPLTQSFYRLTLAPKAMAALAAWKAARKPATVIYAVQREDLKYDVAISHSLADQLQTAALPKENLSDTVLRVMAKAQP